MALLERQQRFVEFYFLNPHRVEAYQKAGYKARGHSAEVAADRLLKKVAVQEALAQLREERARQVQKSGRDVIERLWEEALRFGKGSSQAARVRALQLLGLHFGLFARRLEVNGTNDQPIRVTRELSDAELEQIVAVRGPQPDSCTDRDPTTPSYPPNPPTSHRGCPTAGRDGV
jgi:hypothetical protein